MDTPKTPTKRRSSAPSSPKKRSRTKSHGTLTRKFRENPVVAFINKSEVDITVIKAILNVLPKEAITKVILFGYKAHGNGVLSMAIMKSILFAIPKTTLINVILFAYKSQGPDRQKLIFKLLQEQQRISAK